MSGLGPRNSATSTQKVLAMLSDAFICVCVSANIAGYSSDANLQA